MAELLIPVFTPKFKKQYKKLPESIKQKFSKQLQLLIKDYRYPSLRTKKMTGINRFEARVDLHNRFTFQIKEKEIYLLTIGPHDEGLGKK